jgi:hypothetical protein
MLSDDGGVGTTSWSVRRARLSFGDLTGPFLAAFTFERLRADALAARRMGRLAERAVDLAGFRLEADLARPDSLRFAMKNVLSNLDSLSISVVLSDAYRNS